MFRQFITAVYLIGLGALIRLLDVRSVIETQLFMEAIKTDLHDCFRFEEDFPKAKRVVKPHRVMVQGEFIKTPKGKTIWPSIAAAKAALRMHYYYAITNTVLEHQKVEKLNRPYAGRYAKATREKAWQEFLKWGQNAGFLEFIPAEL